MTDAKHKPYSFYLPVRKPGIFSLGMIGCLATLGTITAPLFAGISIFSYLIRNDSHLSTTMFFLAVIAVGISTLWSYYFHELQRRRKGHTGFLAIDRQKFLYQLDDLTATVPLDCILAVDLVWVWTENGGGREDVRLRYVGSAGIENTLNIEASVFGDLYELGNPAKVLEEQIMKIRGY